MAGLFKNILMKKWREMGLKCKIWDSYRNPLRTYRKVRKWFKKPKMKIRFNKFYCFNKTDRVIFYFHSTDVIWKDKYDTPRHESNPYIRVILFGLFEMFITWEYGDVYCNDDTWEQILWTCYYCDNDIRKAYRTWPWYTNTTRTTTWDSTMLTLKAQFELMGVAWDETLMDEN